MCQEKFKLLRAALLAFTTVIPVGVAGISCLAASGTSTPAAMTEITPHPTAIPTVFSTADVIALVDFGQPYELNGVKGTFVPMTLAEGHIVVTTLRYASDLQFASEGKAARAGAYAIAPWSKYVILGLSTIGTGIQLYKVVKK
jgi:hypothetical protein